MTTILDASFLLAFLLVGHLLADTVLQPRVLSDSKWRNGPIWWPLALTIHAGIHATFVLLFTGSSVLSGAELVTHWITDLAKCRRALSTRNDQIVHIVCKFVWWSWVIMR